MCIMDTYIVTLRGKRLRGKAHQHRGAVARDLLEQAGGLKTTLPKSNGSKTKAPPKLCLRLAEPSTPPVTSGILIERSIAP